MIREIDKLGAKREILEKIDWFAPPPPDFEHQIRTALEELRRVRREQGWEID